MRSLQTMTTMDCGMEFSAYVFFRGYIFHQLKQYIYNIMHKFLLLTFILVPLCPALHPGQDSQQLHDEIIEGTSDSQSEHSVITLDITFPSPTSSCVDISRYNTPASLHASELVLSLTILGWRSASGQ